MYYFSLWRKVLAEIQSNPFHTAKTLSDHFGVSRQSINRTLQTLEKRGYVQRVPPQMIVVGELPKDGGGD